MNDDSRWRHPRVPPGEVILLLPELPQTARLWRDSPSWSGMLRSFGIAVTLCEPLPGGLGSRRPRHAHLEPLQGPAALVVGPAAWAARSMAHSVLVQGRDPRGHLTRAGYQVVSYIARRGPTGAVRLEPLNGLVRRGQERQGGGTRRLLINAIRGAQGSHYVTIGHRDDVTPAVVAAAFGQTRNLVLLAGGGGGGARRRSTFLVGEDGGADACTAVKVTQWQSGARGWHEQQVLHRLQRLDRLADKVPQPQGYGQLATLCWSAESAVQGQPLRQILHRVAEPNKIVATLNEIGGWLTTLAVTTRNTSPRGLDRAGLRLCGEHEPLAALYATLRDVPGVLVHGDIGTGGNVLVSDGSFSIIDWETARDGAPPLTDLLPFIGLALATLRGHVQSGDAARYVMRLFAGLEADSVWALDLVRAYCRRVSVPLGQAGTLGALAWGYQASMRLVHRELVHRDGGAAADWESPADEIAREWLAHPDLGASWRALTAAT